MVYLARMIITTEGFPGAPGVNVLHWVYGTEVGDWTTARVTALHDAFQDTWSGLSQFLRSGTSITVEPDFPIIDPATGEIQTVLTATDSVDALAGNGGTPAPPWSAAALVQFRTGQYVNGRRVQGRMFFGPLGAAGVDNDGSAKEGMRTGISDDLAGYITGLDPRLCIWRRPSTSESADGGWSYVSQVTVRETLSNLRRRDF